MLGEQVFPLRIGGAGLLRRGAIVVEYADIAKRFGWRALWEFAGAVANEKQYRVAFRDVVVQLFEQGSRTLVEMFLVLHVDRGSAQDARDLPAKTFQLARNRRNEYPKLARRCHERAR